MLRTARSKDVSAMVQSGEVHLGLRYFADPNPDIVSQEVGDESLGVVCSAQHVFDRKRQLEARDLAGMPWVSFPTGVGDSGEPFTEVLEQQLRRAGLGSAELIAIDSLTAQKRLIEADFGFGLLPLSSIQEELQLGALQLLDIPEPANQRADYGHLPSTWLFEQRGKKPLASSLICDITSQPQPASRRDAVNTRSAHTPAWSDGHRVGSDEHGRLKPTSLAVTSKPAETQM